jgi:hypothetical protein
MNELTSHDGISLRASRVRHEVHHGLSQTIDVDRLGQVHLVTCRERQGLVVLSDKSSERQGRNIAAPRGAAGSQAPQEAVPILTWHGDIAQQNRGAKLVDNRHRLRRRLRHSDASACPVERLGDRIAHATVVVYDKNADVM